MIILLLSMAAAWQPASAVDTDGFIYGTITTRDGDTYTGTMRWGKQEVFWDDLFNTTKEENPWTRYVPRRHRDEDDEYRIKVFGIRVYDSFGTEHLFICKFGDITRIENRRHNRSTVIMKNETEFDVEGGGDLDVKIRMLDENLGKVNIDWDNIKRIEFADTPKSAKTPGYRLKGKVKTYEKEFEGYVMWDAEECVSTDILDGETDDGDMEIEFGNIRSIKRLNRRSCQVTLKDGREFRLSGTNDVNSDNRGIYVHDYRYGTIEVQWEELQEVVYEDEDDSGRSYKDYKSGKKIEGTVKTIDGGTFDGELVFDLDESEDYEILNGKLDDMEFNIPFNLIKSIQPKGRHSSIIELKGGEKLRLEESQDVSNSNDGVLVFMGRKDTEYIEWEDVEEIRIK
jgi:hypothetical protein